MGKDDELGALISEKELLENGIHLLDEKNNALKISMLAFVEEILEDLHRSNSGNINYYCFITFLSFKGIVTYNSLPTCLCLFFLWDGLFLDFLCPYMTYLFVSLTLPHISYYLVSICICIASFHID